MYQMATNATPQTPTEDQRRDFARGQLETAAYLQKHVNDEAPLEMTAENAKAIANSIKERPELGGWCVSAIEAAVEELRDTGELTFSVPPQEYFGPDPVFEETPVLQVEESYPWGEALDLERLKSLTAQETRRWMTDRQYGEIFKKQMVEAGAGYRFRQSV
jgi:hypothetical protein